MVVPLTIFLISFQVVTDTLATVPQQMLGDGLSSLADGMVGMKRMVERQKHLMEKLNEEVAEYKDNETHLRASITFLTEETMLLKKAREEMEVNKKKEQDDLKRKIAQLDQDWRWEKATVVKLEKKLNTTDTWFRDTVKHMETEIATLKEKLRVAEMQAKAAQTERNAAKQELADVQDRTRKLLSRLDLNNDVSKAALSVDHARNISYVRRRKPALNTISASPNMLTATDQPLLYTRKSNGTASAVLVSNDSDTTSPNAASTSSKKPKIDFEAIDETNIEIEDVPVDSKTTQEDLKTVTTHNASLNHGVKSQPQCSTCGKFYDEISNFDGACMQHEPGATLLNEGTSLQVWSCCKSAEKFKGCVKSRHIPKEQCINS